jgi:hypothetical protein
MTPTRSILGCLAALTVLTSGCASSEKLVASPASSSPSTATDSTDAEVDRSPFEKPVELPTDSTTSRERKAAARLLRQAKRTLLRTGTGHLTRAVRIGDPDDSTSMRVMRSRGVYDLHRLRARTRTVVFGNLGEDDFKARLITRGRRSLVRLSEWSCWAMMRSSKKSRDGAPTAVFPFEVIGPLRARPVLANEADPGLIVATVPMAIAVFLAGPGFEASLGGRVGGLRVPTEIRIRSKRLVEWSVHGIDIQAALESASIRVGRKYRKSLPYVDISMRLQEPGSRVRVPLPPKNKQAEAPLGSRRFDPDACGVGAEVV